MIVFQLENEWSVENLRIAKKPVPLPGQGQILLKIKAASLNYRDLVVLKRGYGPFTGELPLIPVSDGVGEVVEIGKGSDNSLLGKRVCPLFMPKWISGKPNRDKITSTLGGPIDGLMTEYMAIDQDSVVQIPDFLSDTEASTLPCAALTAWNALIGSGGISRGEKVLIQGTGGVSIFALQMANIIGAKTILISSDDNKLKKAAELGADEIINYVKFPAWGKEIIKLTSGEGVDQVIEVGGEETLPQSLRAVKPGGTISMIGVLSGAKMSVNLGLIVTRKIRMQGITVGNRDDFINMTDFISKNKLKPVIDKVFDFKDLPEAFRYLASAKHFGKICIKHF